jgi:hypothetical protein
LGVWGMLKMRRDTGFTGTCVPRITNKRR